MSQIIRFSLLAIMSGCIGVLCHKCTPATPAPSKGALLSKAYCSSCHLYTEPSLLDRASWSTLLPVMKQKMEYAGQDVSSADWNEIFNYYYSSAPFILSNPYITEEDIIEVAAFIENKEAHSTIGPTVTALHCSDESIVVGLQNGMIKSMTDTSSTLLSNTNSAPIQISGLPHDNSMVVLSMGQIGPHHAAKGQLQNINHGTASTIIDSLHRPIHFSTSDFDLDGEDEYVISSFGSTNDSLITGDLSIFKKNGSHYSRQVLAPYTGATKSIPHDMNKDGLVDILALFSQGDERIILFENRGNLQFEEKVLIRLSPLYGSLDIEIDDLNNDGQEEIILANGDNGDYSIIFKPYHGVRIFEKSSKGDYTEQAFFHINGAAKIILDDYNLDNRIDIMVFALYPDLFRRPWESIQFLYNQGKLEFARGVTRDIPGGHWALCAACDLTKSGKKEIVLGANLSIQKTLPPDVAQSFRTKGSALDVYSIR